MIRRAFFSYGLMLLGVGRKSRSARRERAVGVGWAQTADSSLRYAPLSRPIRIPLDAVATPWQPALFTAEAIAPATAKTASRRVLISGVLFRRLTSTTEQLSALCLTCPHEQCKVDLVTDPARLANITGGTGTHPVFECGCHASVFDALQDGARVSGETPRGLYQFRITSIADGAVEIGEIEEVALFEV